MADKKLEGPLEGGIQPTAKQTKEQKMIEDKLKDEGGKLADPVKKADGGMVLKQATDDRNGTPNKSVCRSGGAAIKGIKFSGVK